MGDWEVRPRQRWLWDTAIALSPSMSSSQSQGFIASPAKKPVPVFIHSPCLCWHYLTELLILPEFV